MESRPGQPLAQAPDRANLVNVQVPEAGPHVLAAAAGRSPEGRVALEAVEAESAAARAVGEAARATGYREEEITAGYLEKLDPFRDAR